MDTYLERNDLKRIVVEFRNVPTDRHSLNRHIDNLENIRITRRPGEGSRPLFDTLENRARKKYEDEREIRHRRLEDRRESSYDRFRLRDEMRAPRCRSHCRYHRESRRDRSYSSRRRSRSFENNTRRYDTRGYETWDLYHQEPEVTEGYYIVPMMVLPVESIYF